jgi:hypothetical protein
VLTQAARLTRRITRGLALIGLALSGCGAASSASLPDEPIAPAQAAPNEAVPDEAVPDEPVVPSEARPAVAPFACASYAGPRVLGTVADPRLSEISGLAVSRAHPDVLYVQNDSGEPHARFFAIDATGALLAEHALAGESAFDLEEIAIGPARDPAHDAIYLADIGDNDARNGRGGRPSIHVLRVEEPPAPPRGGAPIVSVLAPVDHFELRYPEGPIDCEAFFVEPGSGDLYLLGKVASGPAPIFVARAPLETSAPNLLARVGAMLPARDLGDSITAASLAPDGVHLAVRTYRRAFLFTRADGDAWVDALAREPVMLPRLHEPQGEAIAFFDAGGTIVSITEGASAPIHALDPACPAPSGQSRPE